MRADRPAARLAAPRHGVRAADADRQGRHGGAVLGRQDARLAGDDGDRLRRRGRAAARAGGVRRRQRQLAAALRRRDARGDGGPGRARAGHRRDAVPADGGDVARVDPGRAGAADRRAAGRRGLRPARAAGCAGAARLVPLAHGHAVGLARVRRARVGDRPAGVGAAGAALRPAVAFGRRRAHVQPAARRAGDVRGAQHDAARVPGRRELPAALRRLAGVGTGRELHEVPARHRGAEDLAGGVHAARGDAGEPRVRRARRGRPRRPLPRRDPHAGAVPDVLLPPDGVLDRQLPAVDARRRRRRGRAGGGAGAEDDRGLRAAAARRQRAWPSWTSTLRGEGPSWETDAR